MSITSDPVEPPPKRRPLAGLRAKLEPLVGAELDPLWNAFKRRWPDGDIGLFLARLRKSGRINDAQVRDIVLGNEVSITLSEGSGHDAVSATPLGGRRFKELGMLGQGAMGEVFLASDPELRRQVAVKRLKPALTGHPTLVDRFRREAQITAQLDHPGIMPVYAFERDDDGQLEYAMKLIRGITLDDLLQEARVAHSAGHIPDHLNLANRLELFLQVCNAMAYAHERGVVHRDLKPENIMIGAFHEVTVMDWGIARLMGGVGHDGQLVELKSNVTTQTQLGLAIGTPQYMSPEQAEGLNASLDGRSDQYALGLILHEIVGLRRAVEGRTVQELLLLAQEATRQPLKAWSKREPVPPELAAIVRKACQLDPNDRYPTVEHLADDIRHYSRDEAIMAQPDSSLRALNRWVGRHRTFMIGAVAALILAMVLGAVALSGIGTAAVAYNVYRMEARQDAISRVVARVADQGHHIDTRMHSYESLLYGISYASEQALQQEAPEVPVYRDEDFLTPGKGPPDLKERSRFAGAEVSMLWPVFKFAPGVDQAQVMPRAHQLSTVRTTLWRAVAQSGGYEVLDLTWKGQADRVSDDGVPVLWAIVGIEDGLLAGLPGKGGYPADYDPRQRPWYKSARDTNGVSWGEPYIDASGMGLITSCSMALYDRKGSFLGAAALDLDIDMLADELISPDDLIQGDAEGFLVNHDGKIFLRSDKGKNTATTTLMQEEVWQQVISGGRTGEVEVGDQLVAWTWLSSVDWAYVVVGPTEQFIDP